MVKAWNDDGGMIVVLEVSGHDDLKRLKAQAKKQKVVVNHIEDEGLTEVKSGAWTVLAVGPDDNAKVDAITGKLPLYSGAPPEAAGRAAGRAGAGAADAEEEAARLRLEVARLRE